MRLIFRSKILLAKWVSERDVITSGAAGVLQQTPHVLIARNANFRCASHSGSLPTSAPLNQITCRSRMYVHKRHVKRQFDSLHD